MWKEQLENLEGKMQREPDNLALAEAYWSELDRLGGYNMKSGARALHAFRKPAVASSDGVVQLARVFRELLETTGEAPRPEMFDPELIAAIKRTTAVISGEGRADVEWLLETVR